MAARKRRPSAGSGGTRIKSAVYSGDLEAARLLRAACTAMPGGEAVETVPHLLTEGTWRRGATQLELLAACASHARESLEASKEGDHERAIRHVSRARAAWERSQTTQIQQEAGRAAGRANARRFAEDHDTYRRLARDLRKRKPHESQRWRAREIARHCSAKVGTVLDFLSRENL